MGELKGCLQAILRERAVVAGPDGKGLVTLSERREGGRSSMHVRVGHVPDTTTVISLQKTSQHQILRQSPGRLWLKICDYILVREGADDCKVVMVELKSTLQKRAEGLEQLRRSLPIAKYLLTVCEVELRRSWPCKFSYALIAEKRTNRLDKQRTRPDTQLSTEDYEDIKVAVGVGSRFDFGALVAGG